MGECVEFPGSSRGCHVSERLSLELYNVRERLGLIDALTSNAVIDDPLLETYDPHIRLSGKMQLGRLGIEHFHETFTNCEVDIPKLYVCYMGVRSGLDRIRLRDYTFQAELHRTATQIEGIMRERFHTDDVNVIEEGLVGYLAAQWAKGRAVTPPNMPRALRALEFAKIQSAAVDVEHKVRHDRPAAKAMLHFGLSLSGYDKQLKGIVGRILQSQSQ